MTIFAKFTKISYLQSAIENGVYASELKNLNDPYEWAGVRYPESYRVCCLSKSKLKMLMWSHYATHHGCRIDFEIPAEFNDLVREVTYTDCFTQRADMAGEELFESLYQKGSEWKYEEEVRAAWCSDSSDDRWIEIDGKIFLRARVVKVTFGLLADAEGGYKEALDYIAKYNKRRDKSLAIKVSKCRMKNAVYQLTEDGQYDYEKELRRLQA